MRTYTFRLAIRGTGSSEEEAWDDAVQAFMADPGDPHEVVNILEDDEGEDTDSIERVEGVELGAILKMEEDNVDRRVDMGFSTIRDECSGGQPNLSVHVIIDTVTRSADIIFGIEKTIRTDRAGIAYLLDVLGRSFRVLDNLRPASLIPGVIYPGHHPTTDTPAVGVGTVPAGNDPVGW